MFTNYYALSVHDIEHRANIDHNNHFVLTDHERRAMNNESKHDFMAYADEFLTRVGMELLPNGDVVGPVGVVFSQKFEEEYREHLAQWNPIELFNAWAEIDSSRVTLTVNWVDGIATLTRRYGWSFVEIGQVEFEATEEEDTTYEALNEALERAGIPVEWTEAHTETVGPGDTVTITGYGLSNI